MGDCDFCWKGCGCGVTFFYNEIYQSWIQSIRYAHFFEITKLKERHCESLLFDEAICILLRNNVDCFVPRNDD